MGRYEKRMLIIPREKVISNVVFLGTFVILVILVVGLVLREGVQRISDVKYMILMVF
jgi:hypothetical protein